MSYAILRQHPRFPVRLQAEISLADGEWSTCPASNLSRGGMLVCVAKRVPLYSRARVRFRLGEDATAFEFAAEVRSCIARAGGHDLGLRFAPAESPENVRLESIIEREFERRESRRYAMRTRVSARRMLQRTGVRNAAADAVEHFELFGRDISLKGMRLHSEQALQPGQQLEVQLKFRLGHQLMVADGVVRWCQPDTRLNRYDVGVEFTTLDRPFVDFLNALVSYARR